jgi:predicted MPP superfamily phosphohydrolase
VSNWYVNFSAVALADRELFLLGLRTVLSVLLAGVQLYVLRAIFRMVRSIQLDRSTEKVWIGLSIAFLIVINLPLALFFVEGFINPKSILLYSPPIDYERLVRPFAYTFFVWTIGSLLFAASAPIAMGCYAAVQFLRRKTRVEGYTTVEVFDLSRRRFLQAALTAVSAMPFAVSAYGAVAARSRTTVERVIVPIAGLPPELEDFTIVQLSDIHSGMFMNESRMADYARLANELHPDIIALTGDFVASRNDQVDAFIRAMSLLKAKHGVFGCLGNHDIFTHSEQGISEGFKNSGFTLLRNQNQIIDIDGAKLNIIGVDYLFGGRSSGDVLTRALGELSLEGTTVLLQHAPQLFPVAAKLGIDLTLSGHTHGGQIALTLGDLIIAPAALSTMFLAGLFKIGDSHLYVNRGLGTTGPPIRINAPPEITHITLKSSGTAR